MKLIDQIYGWFLRGANVCQSPLLLAVRLYWGWQFWQSGWGKLMNIPHVTEYFTSLGVPAPAMNAHFIAWLEAVGGILLALGLFSRLIAFPLVIDMVVAFVIGDREALGAFLADPDKFYAAAPYTFLQNFEEDNSGTLLAAACDFDDAPELTAEQLERMFAGAEDS
jgi:putative oxidoreductase